MIRYLKALITTIFLLTAAGCGMVGLPFTGQVTDAKTGEPIADAIVVAMWRGDVGLIADSTRICYHAETAVSDENGKFIIQGWLGGSFGVLNRHVVTRAYKKGYEEAQGREVYKDGKHKDEIKMTRFTGANNEWFQYLDKYVRLASCHEGGTSRKNLANFYETIYRDVRKTAKSKEELQTVNGLRAAAASAGVAAPLDMNANDTDKLEQKYIKEHLE